MKHILLGLTLSITLCGRGGLPARSGPDSYPVKATGPNGLVIAAEVMDPEQIRNEFSTSLTPAYLVFEVAVYPSAGSTVDLATLDFALRIDGRFIRPASPETIAALNQKKAKRGGRDITLYPSVGVSTGTWGTGTMVGVGVGPGGGGPPPASTDRDRRTMETALDDRGLQDAIIDKPVAGYLYFPVGQTKATSMDLVYQHDSGELSIPLVVPKKK